MSEPDVQLPLIDDLAPLVVAGKPFVTFELPGEPRAWERPGAGIRWGAGRPFIHWFVRAEEARYRESIAWAARAAMGSRRPTDKPTAIILHAFLPIPESWHWRKKQQARSGLILPTGKPDHDNFLKLVCDALKRVVWLDDAGVVDGRCIKKFSERPAMRVEVREFISPK
jgi:Holliday junction resolvase RusA-like endonuclease